MMKGMLKRALGVVAAAAMAVTGAVALSGTANADDGGESTGAAVTTGTVKTCTGGVTVTFHADHEEQLQNATFSVYKLADYVEYQDAKKNSVYGVQTSQKTDEGLTAVKDALNKAVGNEYPANSTKDPMAWLMGQDTQGWQDDNSWGYVSGVADSKVRKFADNLDTSQLTAASGYSVNNAVEAQGGVTRSITGLDAGVYLFTVVSGNVKVTSTVPMIVSTGTYSNGVLDPCQVAQVEIKNNVLTDQTKVADVESASIGDEIEYLLSGQVPATAVDEFKFKDKPGVGLTIRKGTIKVYATDQRVTVDNKDQVLKGVNPLPDKEYSVSWNDLTAVDANDNATTDVIDGYKAVPDQTPITKNQTFEVKLTTPGSHQGKWITVVYTARVNDEVDLEDGIVNELYNKGEWDKTTTKMYGFTIDKRNTDEEAIPGVTFQIKDEKGTALPFFPMTANDKVANAGETVVYYRKAAHSGTTGAVTELTTGANGKIVVKGLGEGVYNVVETGNGDDYINVYADFKVTIGANGQVTVSKDDANKLATSDSVSGTTVTVINARNITQLPLTGAAGVTMFVVLGLLIAGAGVTVYMKSRNIRKAMR